MLRVSLVPVWLSHPLSMALLVDSRQVQGRTKRQRSAKVSLVRYLTLRCFLGLLCLVLLGCSESVNSANNQQSAAKPMRHTSSDQSVSVVLPIDLIVHAFNGSVQGATLDGSYRLSVERLPAERLIRLAASAKDAWSARGWEVTGEQHFERALFVALKRGGTKRNPRERREVWWVEREGSIALCDVIASESAFERLGEPVRTGCQTIEALPWPEPEGG